jgi:hypothetical protein
VKKSPTEKADAAKRQRLWKFYRVTPEEQAAVEAFQKKDKDLSVLLERGNTNDTSPALLFTDHNHSTGLIRGRLAYLINKALGVFESSYKERTSIILRALADYLDNPPMTQVLGVARYGIIGRAKQKKEMIYGSADGPITAPKKPKGPKKKSCPKI